MEFRLLTSPEDLAVYDAWVKSHPQGNLWQSRERGAYCTARRQEVRIYAALEDAQILASALVVIDATAGGYSTWEIPRGPLWATPEAAGALVTHIAREAKNDRCMAFFLSPQEPLEIPGLRLKPSKRLIHAEATRFVDLRPSEEEILAQMHQKGRYNIKVAERHGIVVRPSSDVAIFQHLLEATAARDAFTGHSRAHYEAFLKHLPGSFLLLAHTPTDEPVAGLMGVIWNGIGIYYYGASSHAHRALMAPYLLQWQAMRMCKAQGCPTYDLLGIAPPDAADHPWAGISEFKAKFGGLVVTYPPERQLILRPVAWKALKVKRKILG